MFYWEAHSTDGSFEDESEAFFEDRKKAYEDMRNAVLEKMKWNTEYDEDFEDGESVSYEVEFSRDRIVHKSYSGEYIYELREEK